MKVSYFETGRYVLPPDVPHEWPVPPDCYDSEIGTAALRGMVERVRFVEQLGFDWISLSEHHYSPRILTPSPVVSATWLAAHVERIKIAMLGPIVPVSNPIRIAEELAMLDTLAPGRIVVGLLRGTTNEYLSYDLNPADAAKRAPDFLSAELTQRLKRGPVSFHLKAQLAASGDPTKDPTKPWPDSRGVVDLGTIPIDHVVPNSDEAQKQLLFLPTALTDGIEASDDPLIQLRDAAYAYAAA